MCAARSARRELLSLARVSIVPICKPALLKLKMQSPMNKTLSIIAIAKFLEPRVPSRATDKAKPTPQRTNPRILMNSSKVCGYEDIPEPTLFSTLAMKNMAIPAMNSFLSIVTPFFVVRP